MKHILQRLTNTLSTTLILTIQASITQSDFVFKGFYNNGIGNWCNYLPIYEING